MSIEPGAIVMRNGRYGYQARIVCGDYAALRCQKMQNWLQKDTSTPLNFGLHKPKNRSNCGAVFKWSFPHYPQVFPQEI